MCVWEPCVSKQARDSQTGNGDVRCIHNSSDRVVEVEVEVAVVVVVAAVNLCTFY